METNDKYYLLRNSLKEAELKIVLGSNNLAELQSIKNVMELVVPNEVSKFIRYSIVENEFFESQNS